MRASLHIMSRVDEKGTEITTRDALGILVRRDMIQIEAISVGLDRVLLLLPEIPYNLMLMSLVPLNLHTICRPLNLLGMNPAILGAK